MAQKLQLQHHLFSSRRRLTTHLLHYFQIPLSTIHYEGITW